MWKLFYFVVQINFVLGQNSSQLLTCYDCDSTMASEDCFSKTGSDAPIARCKTNTSVCLSAYIENTEDRNKSGIQRGCVNFEPDIQDICDWFKQENYNISRNVISCHYCRTPNCNNIVLYPDGTSGAVTYENSFNLIIFATVLSIVVTISCHN